MRSFNPAGDRVGIHPGIIRATLMIITGLTAAFVFNINMLLAAFWSEWLISREKTKGTFAWLRACPIGSPMRS